MCKSGADAHASSQLRHMAEKRGLKRKHSATSFQKECPKIWPCIQPLAENPEKAFCTVCNSSFSIVHQGRRDVESHIQGMEHEQLVAVVNFCQKIKSFVPDQTAADKVTNAEVMFTAFLLEHNLPYEASSHAVPLFRKMFPDSDIAKKYGCAATKTAAIVNYSLAPSLHDPLVTHLQENPFSLAIDGSSDTGTESMYPLVLRIYDEKLKAVCSRFWKMCLVSDGTANGKRLLKCLNQMVYRGAI